MPINYLALAIACSAPAPDVSYTALTASAASL